MRLLFAATLLLSLAACDTAEERTIGGDYLFEDGPDAMGLATQASLSIPTTASGERFSFSYTFRQSSGGAVVEDRAGTGSGRYDHPTLTFALEGTTATGTVSDDGDRITLDEPGRDPFITYVRVSR